MESDENPLRTRYVIHTDVSEIKFMEDQWFAHFKGSWESLGLGPDKPNFAKGDQVRITIERLY